MESEAVKKNIITAILILKDIIRWTAIALVFTTIMAVCMENGWFSKQPAEVSREDFFLVYLIWTILFVGLGLPCKIAMGKYGVEIIEHKEPKPMGIAVQEKPKFRVIEGGKNGRI